MAELYCLFTKSVRI